jgi:hypothetical protein
MNTLVRLAAGSMVLALACKRGGDASDDTGTTGASDSGAADTATPSTMTTPAPGTGSAADDAPADTTGSPPGDSTGEPPATTCGDASSSALAACVDPAAIADDIGFIADIRTPGSTHWLAVQELCADRLEQLGYAVELHEYATGINVIGRRTGARSPGEVVLVGAHYDHIPECLGADDNASGVAGALEVARVLAEVPIDRTLAIACWDEEELGLVGSQAWVAGGMAAGESVAVYLNYDMIGYRSDAPGSQQIPLGFDLFFPDQYAQVQNNEFRGDFIVAIADELATEPLAAYVAHAGDLGLPTISAALDAKAKNSDLLSDLRRSDHASFWAEDLPAIFFTDSGELRNAGYHCFGAEDTVDTLDMQFAAQVVAATVGAAADTLELGG